MLLNTYRPQKVEHKPCGCVVESYLEHNGREWIHCGGKKCEAYHANVREVVRRDDLGEFPNTRAAADAVASHHRTQPSTRIRMIPGRTYRRTN